MEIPAAIFDTIWRSKSANEKYITNILKEKVNFKGKKVLDFGCGTGSYCYLFDSDKYIGIEISKKRINYAKKKYSRYQFKEIKKDFFENCKVKFDFIFIVSVLHHMASEEIKENLKRFDKILKPNGAIVGMEPYLSPKHRFNNRFMGFIDRGKFIRSEEKYRNLFKGLFKFKIQKKYIRNFLYNELFYIAYKKPGSSQTKSTFS